MTVWHLSRAILETAWISAPTVVQAQFGSLTPEICDARLDSWSKRLLAQAKITIAMHGIENAGKGEAFVVMSNHQSLYDIPVIFQALNLRVRMVAKKELFKVPMWSSAMRASGFVEVDRQNRDRAIESLSSARSAIDAGTSIWIAPEGTRSPTGKLGHFKKGGFHMALGAGARILPVTIVGTRKVLVARGWTVHPGAEVHVYVHPPIDPHQFGLERRDELVRHVRDAIAQKLPEENPSAEKLHAQRRELRTSGDAH